MEEKPCALANCLLTARILFTLTCLNDPDHICIVREKEERDKGEKDMGEEKR